VVNGAEKSLLNIPDEGIESLRVCLCFQPDRPVPLAGCIRIVPRGDHYLRADHKAPGLKKRRDHRPILLAILTVYILIYLDLPLPAKATALPSKDFLDSVKGFVVSSALIGCIIGGALAGFVSKSLGRKKGLILSALAFTVSAVGAWRPEAFNIFGTTRCIFIRRLPHHRRYRSGACIHAVTMYIAEIAPAGIRGKLVHGTSLPSSSGC